jgi:hypothetical protein
MFFDKIGVSGWWSIKGQAKVICKKQLERMVNERMSRQKYLKGYLSSISQTAK